MSLGIMQLCATHQMSDRLCGCGLPAAPAEPVVRERVRDFTAEREGMRLRTPFAGCVVARCPACGKLGAYCTSGKRGQRRALWVHEAVVSFVGDDCKGYTTHDSCSRVGEALDAWMRSRKRAAKRASAKAGAS